MNFKKVILITSLVVLIIGPSYSQNARETSMSKMDSVSYAMGADISRTIKSSGSEVDLAMLIQGLSTAYLGGELLLDESTGMRVLQQHFIEMRRKQTEALREPGEKFLAELKSKPGIQETAEGVLYEVITAGEGRKPTASDEIKVHYEGYLIDGTKFDSSYDRGEPIVLHLDRVIAGWNIIVPMMNVGAKYKLYIPYELGYGERGSGRIPPYSTLIFEIELLDIIKPDGEV